MSVTSQQKVVKLPVFAAAVKVRVACVELKDRLTNPHAL